MEMMTMAEVCHKDLVIVCMEDLPAQQKGGLNMMLIDQCTGRPTPVVGQEEGRQSYEEGVNPIFVISCYV